MCPSCHKSSELRISIAALTGTQSTQDTAADENTRTEPELSSPRSRGGGKHICEHPSCGRSFTRKSNMHAHKRMHLPASDLNAHPFSCEYCSRRFKWRSSKVAHQETCSHLILEAGRLKIDHAKGDGLYKRVNKKGISPLSLSHPSALSPKVGSLTFGKPGKASRFPFRLGSSRLGSTKPPKKARVSRSSMR